MGIGLQVSGIINMPLAIALWAAAAILLLWRFGKRMLVWLKPQGLAHKDKPLNFGIGETAYITSQPYTEERIVKDIICQVILGNPNEIAKSIANFRLEVESKEPYLLSEARDSKRGGSFLVPPGGGFSTVPRKQWLKTPIRVNGSDGVVGWIGFCLLERNDLTLGEAWKMDAELVAIQADETELRSIFPKCNLPPAQPP